MELADYNVMFVHIEGKQIILADAIPRLITLNVYKEPLENQKTSVVSNMKENIMEIYATDMHTISASMHCTDERLEKTYMKLVSQICHGNTQKLQVSYYVFKWYPTTTTIHSWLKTWCHHSTTFIIPTILHEFHDSEGHQGTIFMFEAIRRSYWWPKLWQDIVKYIGQCIVC